MRVNAIFALGWFDRHEDVLAVLRDVLLDPEQSDTSRAASACAMALSRDLTHLPYLERARTQEGLGSQTRTAVDAAKEILMGDDLRRIESLVKEICGDRLTRPRMFFRPTLPEGPR